MKKLYKGLAAIYFAISLSVFTAVPAWAVSNLCPNDETGIKVPGCGKDVQIADIISAGISILLFGAFVIALLFLIVGGIKWIMSGGEKDGANKAKETITSALIGLAVVLGAWLLLNVVVQLLTGSSFSAINVPSLSGLGS